MPVGRDAEPEGRDADQRRSSCRARRRPSSLSQQREQRVRAAPPAAPARTRRPAAAARAVAELAQPPHRRQRGRQRDPVAAIRTRFRRGHRRPPLPRPRSPPKRWACRSNIVAVAPAQRHQLVVAAELDHPAVLEHADAVGVPDGREAVRDEDRGARRGVAASMRSKISASPRTSSCAVGSSSSTTPAPGRTAHSARASATRCHCPPDRSVPPA